MINKIEFEIIKSLLLSPDIDEIKYNTEISSLLKDKLVRYNITGETRTKILYNGYAVTSHGLRAYEEYIAFTESQSREIETVKVAKEANDIAERANALSEKANNIASSSKTLSRRAIVVSIIATIISVIDIIVSNCT